MINIEPKLKNRLDEAVKNNEEIVFVAYSLLEKFESGIKYVIGLSLPGGVNDDLFSPIFTCVKELTTNAVKANIKKVLINDGIIKNPSDLEETVAKTKSVLNERDMLEYAIKAKNYGLNVRIYIKIESGRLKVRVINPVPLTDAQDERIQKKINTAKKYESLAEFYIDNPDPFAEGMGLGLSLVVVMLKGAMIKDAVFEVTSLKKTKTFAKLEIPV